MPRWLLSLCVLFFFPLRGVAQLAPHISVFGGYTFVHANSYYQVTDFSLNGWDSSLEVKPVRWLGLVADVSQQYATINGEPEKQTTALFGPRIFFPGNPRVVPYVHALFGIAHGTKDLINCIPEATCPPILYANTFAAVAGGGVDIKVKGPVWIRALQVDWLHANFNPDHHTQLRLATGIVIRFGR